jgi:GTP-binding protein
VLLDLSPMALATPAEQQEVLLQELGAYQPDLLDRPRLVIGSKADLAQPGAGDDVDLDLRVSAVTGSEIERLKGHLAVAVRSAREELPEPTQFVVHRPVRQGYEIDRDDSGRWFVSGREVVRAVAFSDLTRPDALDEAHRRLRKLGVDRALARAGVQPGDTVQIGALAFEYTGDDMV